MSTPETTAANTWATEHRLTVLAQTEGRPSAADSHGQRWLERRATGLVLAACNCGYTTGWITKQTLPSSAWLIARHGVPG